MPVIPGRFGSKPPAKPPEEKPRTPVASAMRTHAEESRAFLADVIAALPYSDFQHRFTLQTFELTLYVAASDLWETVEDEQRCAVVGNLSKLLTLRTSPLYAELEGLLVVAAEKVRDTALDDDAWLERESRVAKRTMSRTLRHGTAGGQERVAMQLMDRKFPKPSRDATPPALTINMSAEAMALLSEAARVAGAAMRGHISLPPALLVESKDVTPPPTDPPPAPAPAR